MRRVVLFLCLSALPVAAQGFYPSMPGVDCYCTDTTGGRVEMGAETCLTVGGRSFMALCDMSLNVSIWRDTGRDCLSS